jgi:hypothetical protein
VAYQAAARLEEHEDSKKPVRKNDFGEQKRVRKVRWSVGMAFCGKFDLFGKFERMVLLSYPIPHFLCLERLEKPLFPIGSLRWLDTKSG